MGLLGKSNPSRPEKVPTDTVIPLLIWDYQRHTRDSCLHFAFRFDDVLDPEALRRSLERLLQMEGWRRLGARLRMNDNGTLEYHVPAHYDDNRPGFSYTVVKHALGINEHPLAARLPQATAQPSLLGEPEDIASVFLAPDCPRRMEDWIYSDRPQLAIDIVSFEDATLLTVTVLHTLMDTMAFASFCKAWTAVLNGQEDQVPTFHVFNEDPLIPLMNRTPAEVYVNAAFFLKGLRLLVFIFYYLFEFIWHRADNYHMICIPGHYVDEMRTQALQELTEQNNEQPAPFLSESDVLLAWWFKVMMKALNPSPGRMVSLLNVYDIRSTVLQETPSDNVAFITNAALMSITFLRVRQILHEPVSFVASQIRHSLIQQRTKQQIEAYFASQKSNLMNIGNPPAFATATGMITCCSNWHRARLFEVDFSSAVVASGIPLVSRSNALGRPSCVIPTINSNGISVRNIGPVVGKDAAGNWWLAWRLRASAWSVIEQELDVLGGKKGQ
ncbi:hypothetical protein BBP40_002510 [Aspergillus hancockii]|nr:hypothetical protein BBP40_002510 [Aspergillus hancockii]